MHYTYIYILYSHRLKCVTLVISLVNTEAYMQGRLSAAKKEILDKGHCIISYQSKRNTKT